jgi:hypothetical protein
MPIATLADRNGQAPDGEAVRTIHSCSPFDGRGDGMRNFLKSRQAVVTTRVLASTSGLVVLAAVLAAGSKWSG